MRRIEKRFGELRAKHQRALVTFVTAGDPDLATTKALALAMQEAGADLIELGVPFSDPIAEGPTIQKASERALRGGVTLSKILALVKELREEVSVPLVLMGYANVFLAMGAEAFAASAHDAGVDGVILADLPPEEGAEFYGAMERVQIDAILLAAPTTKDARLTMLAEKTRGFLYYVSLTGVTGARSALAAGIRERVEFARKQSKIPVCVGFGVSTPEQAREIAAYADGVVVGSAIVQLVGNAPSRDEAVRSVSRFVAELKAALA